MELGTIYEQYAKEVYLFVLRLSGDSHLAEDIMQTTFVKAIEKLDTFRGNCKLSSWLCQIAKNEYLDYIRKDQKRKKADTKTEQFEMVEKQVPIEEQIENQDFAARIRKAVHLLAEPYREVFMLRGYGELSFKEIGEIFGKSDVWGRVTYLRSKEKVIEILREGGQKQDGL